MKSSHVFLSFTELFEVQSRDSFLFFICNWRQDYSLSLFMSRVHYKPSLLWLSAGHQPSWFSLTLSFLSGGSKHICGFTCLFTKCCMLPLTKKNWKSWAFLCLLFPFFITAHFIWQQQPKHFRAVIADWPFTMKTYFWKLQIVVFFNFTFTSIGH